MSKKSIASAETDSYSVASTKMSIKSKVSTFAQKFKSKSKSTDTGTKPKKKESSINYQTTASYMALRG